MIPDLKIPIFLQRVHSVESSAADIQDRIAKRAYDKFLERGSSPGFELEDWLAAERELIVNSRVGVRVDDGRIVAEILLPNVDPTGLYVSVTPNDILVVSALDSEGRQVFQTVHFPEEIELSDVAAEHVLDTLFVSAAVSDNQARKVRAAHVA
jgi:hypothetical protein